MGADVIPGVVEGTGRRARSAWMMSMVVAAALLGGCGGDEPPIEPDPDPLVQQFVGTWVADSLVVTSTGDSVIVVDLIAEGGSISLNVQPSGFYILTLSWQGSPIIDSGQLEAREDYIVTTPDNGNPAETYEYQFSGTDVFVMEGPILFPFTSGTPSPGELYARMTLQPG